MLVELVVVPGQSLEVFLELGGAAVGLAELLHLRLQLFGEPAQPPRLLEDH